MSAKPTKIPPLIMLPLSEYVGVNQDDPIRYYRLPVIGALYRRRVELCLAECAGGERVLEIGFGSGVAFPNLSRMYREIHGLDLTADTQAVAAMFAARGIATDLKQGDVLQMPYPDEYFDTLLLVSILEHLRPEQQSSAFGEIRRVLKPGGQVVYGVPVERPFMVFMFKVLGHDIRREHFSTHEEVIQAARSVLQPVRRRVIEGLGGLLGPVYEVGHFRR